FEALFGVRLRSKPPFVSISVEARADLESGRVVMLHGTDYTLRTSLVAGSLLPCLHSRWVIGCGLLTMGAVKGTAGVSAKPGERSAFYAGAGLRAGLELPVSELLHLPGPAFLVQLTGDLLVNIAQPGILVGNEVAWQVAPLSEAAALRLVMVF